MTDAIDLTTEQRKTLNDLLCRFLPGVAVWAYGSRVKWTARPNSDLDLVAFTTPAHRSQVADLKEALAEGNLPFPVDLHVWDDVPERFREIIRKEYVVVQEAKPTESKTSVPGESSVVHIPSTAVPLPSDWRWERLDEVCDGVFDCPHSTPVLTADGPFVVRSQDMRTGVFRMEEAGHVSEDTYQERIVRAEPRYGDLLYSREGTYFGIAAEVPARVRVCLGQRMVLLRPKASQCNHRFLRYWLNSPVMASHTHGHRDGTVAERLNLPTIRQLPVAVPPLPEQRAIAHILGTLDDKIELNRRMNETLEAMARALFKSWFVDFDPVRAKAEGRDTGLPKNLADLFPDSFEDSEMGEIPKGWQISSIGDHMVNFDSNRVPVSGRERANRRGPYPYHGAAGVMDYVDDYLFDGIYLLVGEDGSVVQGNGMAVTQYVWGKLWVNNHAHVLQGKHAVSTEQLYLHFHFESVVPYVTGAVQPKLSQGRMNTMPFLFAGTTVCLAFAEMVQPLFAKLRANSDVNATLAALRDTLLPKLISGELRVGSETRIPPYIETGQQTVVNGGR